MIKLWTASSIASVVTPIPIVACPTSNAFRAKMQQSLIIAISDGELTGGFLSANY